MSRKKAVETIQFRMDNMPYGKPDFPLGLGFNPLIHTAKDERRHYAKIARAKAQRSKNGKDLGDK